MNIDERVFFILSFILLKFMPKEMFPCLARTTSELVADSFPFVTLATIASACFFISAILPSIVPDNSNNSVTRSE